MRPDSAVLLPFPGDAHAPVAAASVALPLTAVSREVVLAAPLIAAGWARSVALAARADGADVRAEPVTTADLVAITVEVVRAQRTSLGALPRWLHASLSAPEAEALDQLRTECLVSMPAAERRSDSVRRELFGELHRYGIGHAERVARIREATASELAVATAALRSGSPILATPVLATPVPDSAWAAVPARSALSAGTYAAGRSTPHAATEDTPAGKAGATTRIPRREAIVVPIAGERACYLAGTAGVALSSESKFPLHVAWALLGGREGLLDRRLRYERNLTYTLAAFSRELADGGYGMFFAGCRAEVLGEVAEEVKGVLQRLCDGDIDCALLRSAKERLIIQQYRALQTERGLAERLCGYDVAGLGPEQIAGYPGRIAAVTAADVRAAAAAYLTPGSLMETWMVPR